MQEEPVLPYGGKERLEALTTNVDSFNGLKCCNKANLQISGDSAVIDCLFHSDNRLFKLEK